MASRPFDRDDDSTAHPLSLEVNIELSGQLPGDGLTQQARAEAGVWLNLDHRSIQFAPVDRQHGLIALLLDRPVDPKATRCGRKSTILDGVCRKLVERHAEDHRGLRR